jgi:LmbE family N-acetylglucosaminyl deacetylase
VVAQEVLRKTAVHFVICSRGEASTHGTPEQRVAEAERAAKILGATLEFLELDGDAHLEFRVSHAIALARIVRRIKPNTLMAPSPAENQHPDHSRLGQLVRDASRLARYGGLKELKDLSPHTIDQLYFYAVLPESVPQNISPVLYDISSPHVLKKWVSSMEAHVSQTSARNYIEVQLSLARFNGSRAGVEHAMALYPSDPLVVKSLDQGVVKGKRF